MAPPWRAENGNVSPQERRPKLSFTVIPGEPRSGETRDLGAAFSGASGLWVPHLRPEFILGPAFGRTRGAFVRDDGGE